MILAALGREAKAYRKDALVQQQAEESRGPMCHAARVPCQQRLKDGSDHSHCRLVVLQRAQQPHECARIPCSWLHNRIVKIGRVFACNLITPERDQRIPACILASIIDN